MPAGSCAEHVMAQLPEDSIRHFSSFDEFYPFYLEHAEPQLAPAALRRHEPRAPPLRLCARDATLGVADPGSGRRLRLRVARPLHLREEPPDDVPAPALQPHGRFPHVVRHAAGTGAVLSRQASTSSGHGTMVDFTVFMAIASATARDTPSSVNG